MDRRLDLIAHCSAERARCAAQHDRLRNDVPGVATVDLGDADDGSFERVHIAAGDRLQAVDDLRRGDNRIDREMRHGRMRAAALDLDLENVEGSHHWSGLDGKLSDR